MEPKDLKNSEEVNETTKADLQKKEEKKTDSGEKKSGKTKPDLAENKDVLSDSDLEKTLETESQKETVSEEPKKESKKATKKPKPEKEEFGDIQEAQKVEKPVKKKKTRKDEEEPAKDIKTENLTKDESKGKKEKKEKPSTEKEKKDIKSKTEGEKEEKTEEKKKKAKVSATKEKSEEEEEKKTVVTEKEEKAVEIKEVKFKDSDTEKESTEEKETKTEDTVAKEKPAKEEKQKKKTETTDYSKYTAVELVNALRDVLENPDDYELKAEIDTIKSAFYKQKNDQIEQEKKAFIDDGGAEEEFVAEENPYEQDIKDLLKRYRQIRIEYNKKLEVEKEENLKRKYEVIENIKNLINAEESINKTFNEFKELQREWREIGLVPQSKMKNLWDLYHFHVENFYDYIKINRELRDLDLKKNLEMKIGLCESAEELLVEPSILKAFNTLQKYHEQWREIGPVPRENKDDIWERFKTVTAKINKKHQEFFENRKGEQKKNLEAKTALCEKVEEICELEIDSFREWDEKSKELIQLQKVWRTIGFAPKRDNNKIYERFRTACDSFFNRKREFYSKNKEEQQNNLQLKIELCELAESLKESNDWKKTTQELINIQRQWKDIGPVPRKQSDIVWKRFRAACDYFFDKKSEHFSEIDSEQVDNLKLKEELIGEVENFKSAGDVEKNLNTLKEFQRKWTEIGHVPYKKKDEMQNRFRQAVNKLYDELNIDEEKRILLKFKNKMASFSETNRGQNKMRMEREKYVNKLKQLENDLVLLDNNIGFFAKSKNAETLIKDVKKKIEITKQKIESLKEKIRVIDELEN